MNLLLVAGFLGSGKTTLILRLAGAITQEHLRTAILVNEIGQVGIDQRLMRQLDLHVWELMGGCICCTLSAGLLAELHKLDQGYDPDLVILEATGAAQPSEVLDALHYYHGRPLQSVRTAVLVDPLRLPKLVQVLGPLMEAQISAADVLILTKTDLVSEAEISECERLVREMNSSAALLATANGSEMEPALLHGVVPWLN